MESLAGQSHSEAEGKCLLLNVNVHLSSNSGCDQITYGGRNMKWFFPLIGYFFKGPVRLTADMRGRRSLDDVSQ